MLLIILMITMVLVMVAIDGVTACLPSGGTPSHAPPQRTHAVHCRQYIGQTGNADASFRRRSWPIVPTWWIRGGYEVPASRIAGGYEVDTRWIRGGYEPFPPFATISTIRAELAYLAIAYTASTRYSYSRFGTRARRPHNPLSTETRLMTLSSTMLAFCARISGLPEAHATLAMLIADQAADDQRWHCSPTEAERTYRAAYRAAACSARHNGRPMLLGGKAR
jgi:hypothetical protein